MTGYLGHVIISLLPCARCALLESCFFAKIQGTFGIQKAEELDGLGHEPGPAGLMAGAEPGSVVAVEVFVEEDVIAPVRIALKFLRAAVDGSPALLVAQEDPAQPVG